VKGECLIKMENVSYSTNGKDIVSDVDLCFRKGRTYAIVGPSGSGKTTIMMLINGLISPTEGKVSYNGTPLEEMEMPHYRSQVPMLFQEPLLLPGDGRKNIMLPFTLETNVGKVPTEEEIREKMRSCGLDETYLDKEISTFSGGEKQRLSLVRTILLRPEAMLLDEPTSALDSKSEKDIINVIRTMAKETLMIYVTHSYQLIGAADDIIVVKGGRISTITDRLDKSRLREILEEV